MLSSSDISRVQDRGMKEMKDLRPIRKLLLFASLLVQLRVRSRTPFDRFGLRHVLRFVE